MLYRKRVTFALALVLSVQATVPLWAAERHLPDGTRIAVRLMEQLSSATTRDQDQVSFAVIEDVVVDGEVVIKQGTPVRGVVVEAESKRRMGRAGKMFYTVNETKGVDKAAIRLRAIEDRKGQSHVTATAVTTASVAVFVPVAAPFFLLRKGKDVVVPEGTRIEAFVDGDHTIVTGAERRTVAEKSGPQLTNADVLALHRAGFGEQVLLAKIEASPVGFSVEAYELVALKQAGVSERVIAAMLAAK
jgi:tRNA pseudouridine-54 N-methylase